MQCVREIAVGVKWGRKALGAVADGGGTQLEQDLAELNDAPAEFRAR